jgi:hypothetical protein
MFKARRFLAIQRTRAEFGSTPGTEIWNEAYNKELKKATLLNRDQLTRQIVKKTQNPNVVPDQETAFKAADLVYRLVKEGEDMTKLGDAEALDRIREVKAMAEANGAKTLDRIRELKGKAEAELDGEALDRIRKLRVKAQAKIDEEEALCRIHEMLDEEGDNIEKAKANGMKQALRRRPTARMMCVKRRSPLKEEKVSSSHQRNLKKWSQQFLITAQGERAAKKLKVMLVSYSGSESDEEPDPEESGDEDNVKKASAYEKMKYDNVRLDTLKRRNM